MKRLGILLSVFVLVTGLSVSAHAALVDMNDGTVYDTDTQLSWLKNANTAGTMPWANAVAWAASLNNGSGYAGLTGWRLPTTTQPDATCSIQSGGDSYGYNCTGSEMGHLYYTELGNAPGGPLSNVGPFTNLQTDLHYSSGTEYAPDPAYEWSFSFVGGYQHHFNGKGGGAYAWAVRPGARTVDGGGATPVGYNPQWLAITLVCLTIAGGFLMRKRIARQ